MTELELTANGEAQVKGTGKILVGQEKLIDPSRITRIFVGPRSRALKTFELLFGDSVSVQDASKVHVTEDIAEWDYGDYEGLLTSEIRARRQEKGLDQDKPWDIWRDGCEGGEYVLTKNSSVVPRAYTNIPYGSSQDVSDRLDRLIAEIHEIQRPYMHGEKPVDVVVVSCARYLPLQDRFKDLASDLLGCPRTYPARFRETIPQVSSERASSVNAATRCHWCAKVCLFAKLQIANMVLVPNNSYFLVIKITTFMIRDSCLDSLFH